MTALEPFKGTEPDHLDDARERWLSELLVADTIEEVRRIRKRKPITAAADGDWSPPWEELGDSPGHPFRGNQYTKIASEEPQTPGIDKPGMILGSDFHPTVVMGYLKANGGREWKATPLPEGIERGVPKECYSNATRLLPILSGEKNDLRYAEGIVYVNSGGMRYEPGGMAFLHGWCVTPDGEVVDNTLPHPEDNHYYGVAYDTREYVAHMRETGMFGVLGGDMNDAYEVIERGSLR